LSDGTIGVGNFFKKWYGVETDRVVWGAVDKFEIRNLKFEIGKHVKTIVFLGRLEEVNGVEVVVEAAGKYKKGQEGARRYKKAQKWEIVFVGEGSYRKQAEKFGKVTGMVKNPQKYLVDADVVITSSYMSMLETAAMGKPIIAVANSELKEDYLEGHPLRKYIKVVENMDELYKGLTLASQGETLRGLGAAREWALKQTPEKLADEYEELWKK
jgi:glycosyltransferase involved in cell wall biosynthesis